MSLADDAIRMRRTKWGNRADLLAEELFVIFSQDKDADASPITLNFPDGAAPVELPPGSSLDPLGDLIFPGLNFPGLETPEQPQPSEEQNGSIFTRTKRTVSHSRLTVPGIVTEAGTGGSHLVSCFPFGVNGQATEEELGREAVFGPSINVPVAELNGQRITVGTYVMVFRHVFYATEVRETIERKGTEENVIDTQTTVSVLSNNTEMVAKEEQEGGSSSFPAIITGGGPGNDYTANVYEEGLSGAVTAVNIRQLDIDAAETIPVGTWAIAVKVPITVGDVTTDQWYMQVPVWL